MNFSLSMASNVNPTMAVQCWAGVTPAYVTGTTGGGNPTATPTAITPGGANHIMIACATEASGAFKPTQGGTPSMTNVCNLTGDGNSQSLVVSYYFTPNTTSVAPNFTQGAGDQVAAQLQEFR
jgi:hypothetical protein